MEIPPSISTTAPTPLTQAERDKRRTVKRPSGKVSHERRYELTRDTYLSRQFIAWDGEGITLSDGRHEYVTLANSRRARLRNTSGHPLRTEEIFKFLIRESAVCGKNVIHIIYGGGYDFNKWLHYMHPDCVDRLYIDGVCYWKQYRVEWRRGKSFQITDREAGVTIRVYDVVSFFQCAFVKACDNYLGTDWFERDRIIKNKAKRSTFTLADLDDVDEYNDAELVNLVRLMDELRERLDKVGLRPQRWDGPGALAAVIMRAHNIKDHIALSPEPVQYAARRAYTGGRFELIKFGHVNGAVYEYDINSAYPDALQHVPSLTQGRWIHTSDRATIAALTRDDFAMVRCTYDSHNDPTLPQPLFYRTDKGRVTYTYRIESNWYWTPEVMTARQYVNQQPDTILVEHEAWVFRPWPNAEKPFGWLPDMYEQRRVLKAAGDGANVGLKLGINSLYGKTAQQIGAKRNPDGSWHLPPFHCLEWAGYVTSWCRAKVLGAALQDLESVIAFETDALFTTRPLDLPVSDKLGEWELTEFDSMTYVQSGFYYATTADGDLVAKTRGVDRGTMNRVDVVTAMRQEKAKDRFVEASLTRFNGYGIARTTHAKWGRWSTTPKRVATQPDGKRIHLGLCERCQDDSVGITLNVWHSTMSFPQRTMGESHPFPIRWADDFVEYPHLSEAENWKDKGLVDYEQG